jgi:RNA polymerase sigma factor (sigma-70 family)
MPEMHEPAWNTLLQQLRGLVRPPDGGLTDAQLLARWLTSQDEAAFELLLWRHGPTVRGVCQRLLRRSQDIEDAVQATFLVFLQKGGTIGKREAVASWLYKVAYRVALRLQRQSSRQQRFDGREMLLPAPKTADVVALHDLHRVLDDEVHRLPRRYRSVFVLRCLQEKSNEETARELAVPTGTVQSRLSRARELLRVRLARRNVTLTSSVLAAGVAGQASAGMPAFLVGSIMTAARLGAAEQAAAAGVVTAEAAALAKGALHAMWLSKVQMTATLVLTVALIGGGSGFSTYRALLAAPPDGPSLVVKAEEPAKSGNAKGKTSRRDQSGAVADPPKKGSQALGETYLQRATSLFKEGRVAEAVAVCRKALAIFEKLVVTVPRSISYRADLARTDHLLGSLLRSTGQTAEAEAVYAKAFALIEAIVREEPSVAEYRAELASLCCDRGQLLADAGKPAEAERSYRRALALHQKLVGDSPRVVEYRAGLATTLSRLGHLLGRTGRSAEAEQLTRQAQAIQEKLATEFPKKPDSHKDTAKGKQKGN